MQQSHSIAEYVSPFPNPWEYLGVPMEDQEDLYQLYFHTFIEQPDALANALNQLMFPPESPIAIEHPASQSPEAHEAAIFFIICDFVAMKYARFHPKFNMKPIPVEILHYLRPPFNQMTSLDIEDQRRFKASLPKEQQEMVIIDD